MKRCDTGLPGVWLLEPTVHGDDRGFFLESWNRRTFADLGLDFDFCQDNHSRSCQGVLRGLHYQTARAQTKLVRVIAGEVFDVAVDLRRGSPTFGRHVGVILSAANRRQLLVPRGFAHGFLVLSGIAEFCYKVDDYYAPEHEAGIRWDDPDLAIPWPLAGMSPRLSAKDAALPRLADLDPARRPGPAT